MENGTEDQDVGPPNPAEPWDVVSDGYVAVVLPMMEYFARQALQLASLPFSPHIVDVATGPGTLALLAANDGAKVSAIDYSTAMVANLQSRANEMGLDIDDVRVGDGQMLPYEDNSFDGAFSQFGLMFFPDRAAGFNELYRVLHPGRRAVVGSMASLSSQFELAIESIGAVLPDLPAGPEESPLSDPQAFTREMSQANFREVMIHTIDYSETLPSLSEFWQKIQSGAAGVALLRQKLGEERWSDVSSAVFDRLREALGDGPVEETYTAHLGVGVK